MKAAEPGVPARIGIFQRVIQYIAVAVIALAVIWCLYDGVGGEEAAEMRVVDATIHVYQADRVEVFVAGEAALGIGLEGGEGTAVVGGVEGVEVAEGGGDTLAEGGVAQPLDHQRALAIVVLEPASGGDQVDRAEVVFV